jgi:hypothetical protein
MSTTEKGSSFSRHVVHTVCKQGKSLGALKSPMHKGQWVLPEFPNAVPLESLCTKPRSGFLFSDIFPMSMVSIRKGTGQFYTVEAG